MPIPNPPIKQTYVKYAMPNATDFHWLRTPAPIVHYELRLKGMASGQLDCAVTKLFQGNATDKYQDVEDYAKRINQTGVYEWDGDAEKSSQSFAGFPREIANKILIRNLVNPFDIKLRYPSWLVLQLEGCWDFSQERRALLAKHDDPPHVTGYTGHNIMLRHVYPDGSVTEDPKADGRSRVVFFGVVHRTGLNSIPPAQGKHLFDLNVRLLGPPDGSGQPTWGFEAQCDPDVGNEGPDEFPSPP